MERVMGIEPTTTAWKAVVLPLNYTRILYFLKDQITFVSFPLGDKNNYIGKKNIRQGVFLKVCVNFFST
jgi:hypothetical protein